MEHEQKPPPPVVRYGHPRQPHEGCGTSKGKYAAKIARRRHACDHFIFSHYVAFALYTHGVWN